MLMPLDWLRSVAAIAFVFGIVVFVHELGHFLAAKALGVYAPRFSIGFGRALWRRRWGETEYVIALLPLGGYVRMASREDETMALLEGGGEHPAGAPETVGGSGVQMTHEGEPTARSREWDPDALAPFGPNPVPADRMFESKPLAGRLLIMVSGVAMNMLLAMVTLAAIAMAGGTAITRTRVVGEVRSLPAVPALGAQLAAGDTILSVNGAPVASWDDLLERLMGGTGDTVRLTTQRARVAVPVGQGGVAREQLALALQPAAAPVVGDVLPDQAGDRGGLRAGDTIIAIGGVPTRTWPEIVSRIERSPGRALDFSVRGRGGARTLSVTPDSVQQTNPLTGAAEVVGRVGAYRALDREPLPPGKAVAFGWSRTWAIAGSIVDVVRGLFDNPASVKQLGGPITIARASADAARGGVERVFMLIAVLSVNLAVFNLLPVPILDGGQIVLNVVESIRGSAFSARTREYILRAGLALILMLFAVVLYNEVVALTRRLLNL